MTDAKWPCLAILALFLSPARAPLPEQAPEPAAEAIRDWMDVDPAVMRGGHEPDDGLALLQAFHSPQLELRGVSAVYGNAPLEKTFPLAREIVRRFGPAGLGVYSGARSGEELGQATPASAALAEALRQNKLTILALGPVTNVATVLREHPDLQHQVEAIVAVAGRRPHQTFVLGSGGQPLMDMNFELDPEGFQVLLDTQVPIVLAPFEISSKVPLTEDDIGRFTGTAFAEYFLPPLRDYIDWYDRRFAIRAIFPFDTVAVATLTSPEWITCEDLPVIIQRQPDDVHPGKEKPYLIVSRDVPSDRYVRYCYTAAKELKDDLMRRLLGEPRK